MVFRKMGLNWFMPALAKSNVGSSRGMVADEWTYVCSFLLKKSMNRCRISLAVRVESILKGTLENELSPRLPAPTDAQLH